MDYKRPSSETLWEKVMEAQVKKRSSQVGKKRKVNLKNGGHFSRKRIRRVLMKRRVARLEDDETRIGIVRRVRTLKKLVPNSESMGLEVLFRQTADYIMSLQKRVRIMQIMVDGLTGSDE